MNAVLARITTSSPSSPGRIDALLARRRTGRRDATVPCHGVQRGPRPGGLRPGRRLRARGWTSGPGSCWILPHMPQFLSVTNLAVVLAPGFCRAGGRDAFPRVISPRACVPSPAWPLLSRCAYLASTLQWDPANPPTRWQRLRRVLHLGDVRSPIWGSALPAAALGQSTTEEMQAVVDSLQALAYRMQDLIETRATPQSHLLAHELLSQVHAWRVGLQDIFRNLSQHPEAADFADFRSRLDAMLGRLEEKIENVVAGEDRASISTRENENSIRLLGAFRGVSEALVNFARQSGGIDWARLREARF